jgi:hypothetical protein
MCIVVSRGKRKVPEDDDDAPSHDDKRTCRRGVVVPAFAVNLVVGSMVEAQDSINNWYRARIEQTSKGDGVLVHFIGWPRKWDEWMQRSSNRLAEVGSRACVVCAHKPFLVTPRALEVIQADGQLDDALTYVCGYASTCVDEIVYMNNAKQLLLYGADPAEALTICPPARDQNSFRRTCVTVGLTQVEVATEALFDKDDAALLPYGIPALIASWVL